MVFSAPIVEARQEAPAGPQHAISAVAVVEAMQSALAPYAASQQALAARVEALEAQRPTWRDTIIIGMACLFLGVMVGLSIWMFQ